MEYEGQICRAPMERSGFMLPVTVGCPYNKCAFCDLFRHLKYRELPMEQIRAEIDRVKDLGGAPKKVFLGDGCAFGQKTERLAEICRMVRDAFPAVEAINMDATVTSIRMKTDEELKRLAELGVTRLYIGIETGLDDVLVFMSKDHHTMAEAEEQIERLHKFGMTYAAHIMTGIAGRGRGEENARALAAFINRTKPAAICNFSVFLHHETPLGKMMADGSFDPADELENIIEDRILVENINVPADSPLAHDGMHDIVKFRVRGTLPRDKEAMLKKFDAAIAERLGEGIYSKV